MKFYHLKDEPNEARIISKIARKSIMPDCAVTLLVKQLSAIPKTTSDYRSFQKS